MRPVLRRRAAVVLALGVFGLAGCGDQVAPAPERVDRLDHVAEDGAGGVVIGRDLGPEVPDYYGGQVPTETPTFEEPPPLDRTELDANLAALSTEDRDLVDHYLNDAELGEGTWVVAAPMTVDEARTRLLGPNPRLFTAADEKAQVSARISAYRFVQLGDGVLAYEDTGFADPPKQLLAELSRDGAVSAVATENIEAMTRFGYARDGEIVFDAFEFAFVRDLDEIPAEVRDLAALSWDDLEGPMVETADWFAVALAMSEKVTGVRATVDALEAGEGPKDRDWYVVPLPWAMGDDAGTSRP